MSNQSSWSTPSATASDGRGTAPGGGAGPREDAVAAGVATGGAADVRVAAEVVGREGGRFEESVESVDEEDSTMTDESGDAVGVTGGHTPGVEGTMVAGGCGCAAEVPTAAGVAVLSGAFAWEG